MKSIKTHSTSQQEESEDGFFISDSLKGRIDFNNLLEENITTKKVIYENHYDKKIYASLYFESGVEIKCLFESIDYEKNKLNLVFLNEDYFFDLIKENKNKFKCEFHNTHNRIFLDCSLSLTKISKDKQDLIIEFNFSDEKELKCQVSN